MAYKIIAFDGGGIRGLVSALLLKNLDPEGRLIRNADMFAGTSTGSFLALALAKGIDLQKIISLYETKGSHIFDEADMDWHCANPFSFEQQVAYDSAARAEVGNPVETVKSVFQAKYKPENLRTELMKWFGSEKIGALPASGPQVVVNSLQLWSEDQRQWEPVSIGSADGDRFGEMYLVDAALSSGAAPTYFPPHAPEAPKGERWGYFADGGIFANNPSASAVAYAVEHFGAELSDMRILSVGTGQTRLGIPGDDIGQPDCWGAWQWLKPYAHDGGTVPAAPLIEAALCASAASCERYAKQMLGDRFVRMNLDLHQAYPLDNWQDVSVLEQAVYEFVGTDCWKQIVDDVHTYWDAPGTLAPPPAAGRKVEPKSKLARIFGI